MQGVQYSKLLVLFNLDRLGGLWNMRRNGTGIIPGDGVP